MRLCPILLFFLPSGQNAESTYSLHVVFHAQTCTVLCLWNFITFVSHLNLVCICSSLFLFCLPVFSLPVPLVSEVLFPQRRGGGEGGPERALPGAGAPGEMGEGHPVAGRSEGMEHAQCACVCVPESPSLPLLLTAP